MTGTEADRPAGRLLPYLLLSLVLLGGAWLHGIESHVLQIQYDDFLLMSASRRIAAGEWRQIFAPQHIHWIPLFRLLRLPFDLHFPAWQPAFHAVVLAAHLAGVVILFLLARLFLKTPWAALAVALLFGWTRTGEEAILWKAASPFLLSWTFLLLSVWCLTRGGAAWIFAAAASLLCAVGFFSGALFAIPGLVLLAILLEPAAARRALALGLSVGIAGGLAWLLLVMPKSDMGHYWSWGGPSAGVPARLGWALVDTIDAFTYQLDSGLLQPRRFQGAPPILLILALVLLRGRIRGRVLAGWFLLTALPLFVIMLIRREPGIWQVSRYGYQSYTLWVVMMAMALDATLQRLERRRAACAALAVVSTAGIAIYLQRQVTAARHDVHYLEAHPMAQPAFWTDWQQAFAIISAHRQELGRPLALPPVDILPGLKLPQLFWVCEPRGLPGLLVDGAAVDANAALEFWHEVSRVRSRLPRLIFLQPPRQP